MIEAPAIQENDRVSPAGISLRPGGTFAVYDVMRTGPGELAYPVPWAETAATDFSAPSVNWSVGFFRRLK